jgi:DNA-binding GntR family transcriptional regulator
MLRQLAYEQLKQWIQSGELAPQTFLSERQLVLRMGMSKTPIRAALGMLEAQGLVAISPQQGIVVRELSVRETNDLFEMRLAVEPFAAQRLAARGLSPDGWRALQANLREQRSAATAHDAPSATRLDIQFHRLLAELLDNRELSQWLARCFDKLERSILRVNLAAPDRLLASYHDHRRIATAIHQQRGPTAARAMTKHLQYGQQFLLQQQ